MKHMFKKWILSVCTGVCILSACSVSAATVPRTLRNTSYAVTSEDELLIVRTDKGLKSDMKSLKVQVNGKTIAKSSYRNYNGGVIRLPIPRQKGGTVLDIFFTKTGKHIHKRVIPIKKIAPEKQVSSFGLDISVIETLPPSFDVSAKKAGTILVKDTKGKVLKKIPYPTPGKEVEFTLPYKLKPQSIYIYVKSKNKRSNVISEYWDTIR